MTKVRWAENTIPKILSFSRYDSRKLFVTFVIVMIALLVEYGISNVADIVSKQIVTPLGIALFIVIAAIYGQRVDDSLNS